MDLYIIRSKLVRWIKNVFNISNFTVFVRRRRQDIQKLFYHQKFSADEIINVIKQSGVNPGSTIIIHSAMGNFYNYTGTAEELIDKLINYLGPKGTLCMPAYPQDKFNTSKVFDVRTAKSAAGYLTEVFRHYPNVKRSLNQLHSVCALGENADYITGEHHLSRICFDDHSPFQKIAELGGFTVNLGMPKWFVGTAEHICEAKLYGRLPFFTEKFSIEKEFSYINEKGESYKHKMLASSNLPYVRKKSIAIIDKYFDKDKYKRTRLSNMWITVFDVKYLSEKLEQLALEERETIYETPKYFE